MEPRCQLALLSAVGGFTPFDKHVSSSASPLRAQGIKTLQINVGRRCNMSCRNCHVEAGPERGEQMSKAVLQQCLDIARHSTVTTIDVTGGAPEMNPHLEWFLGQAAALDGRVIVRTNLTILLDEPYARFMDAYAANRVELVASLPCYLAENTAKLRGEGAFERSIAALRLLNARGYGMPGTGLLLSLVHNPVGASLPGAQAELEADYRERLRQDHGVEFTGLYCLTNCPVGRFLDHLIESDGLRGYMSLLAGAYNAAAAENVMCRTMLSVGWDGTLYDCDFNQMLGLSVNHGAPRHIDRFNLAELSEREIVVRNHCYACTAGAGSSCQGVLAKA
jgi:radical SAM/Cys-rich protein